MVNFSVSLCGEGLLDFSDLRGVGLDVPFLMPHFVIKYCFIGEEGELVISAKDTRRINEDIKSAEVRLIDVDGSQLGVMSTDQALSIAQDRGTDLVEVAPTAKPPVCRLMDYGKFLYEAQKREREARKTQTKVEIKEIRLRPKISDHDIDYRLRDARKFLERGAKVKVRLRFRGREVTHPEVATELMNRVAEELSDVSIVEKRPSREGMTMLMILAPN